MSTAIAGASSPKEEDLSWSRMGYTVLLWQRFRRRRSGIIALVILGLLALAVILIPALSPFSPAQRSSNSLAFSMPMWRADPDSGLLHVFGTDPVGRDIFTREFIGGRISLSMGIIASLICILIGSLIGGVAGLYGGWVDSLLMRFTDFMLALPLLPMYLFSIRLIRATVGATTWDKIDAFTTTATVVGVFVFFGWMGMGRLIRGSILSLRTRTFIEASRALGASNSRIIFRHLLPNAIAPVLVAGTFLVGDFIIIESILAYFGQGIQDPPTVSWGNLLANSQSFVWSLTNLNPFESIDGYLVIFPALLVLITVLCINYVGDALRDALDPREGSS